MFILELQNESGSTTSEVFVHEKTEFGKFAKHGRKHPETYLRFFFLQLEVCLFNISNVSIGFKANVDFVFEIADC